MASPETRKSAIFNTSFLVACFSNGTRLAPANVARRLHWQSNAKLNIGLD
jgi:hypothetical protein